MSTQFLEAVDSLLRFFGDLHVDFKSDYRTRLQDRKVECVAKCLEHEGRIFEADAIRERYRQLLQAFHAKPVDPDSLRLSVEEQRRLAAMDHKHRKRAVKFLFGLGSEKQLQRDFQAAADRIVELLQELRKRDKTRIKRDEANARARGALKGRPPKGKKRWTQRTLARAIGCADGQVSNLPAWQAYAETHGLKRDKGQTAPKAVSLTDNVLATHGTEDEELQRLIADQRREDVDGRAPRRQPRRRKV